MAGENSRLSLDEQIDELDRKLNDASSAAAVPGSGGNGGITIRPGPTSTGDPAYFGQLPQGSGMVSPGSPQGSGSPTVFAPNYGGVPTGTGAAAPGVATDPLTSALDALEAKIKAAETAGPSTVNPNIQQQGEVINTNRPPDYGQPVANWLDDWAKGFNRNVATTLGMIPEATNEALRYIGLGMWDPSKTTAPLAIANSMKKLGMGVDTEMDNSLRTMSSKVGSETFNNLATTFALIQAAPRMAAQQGPQVWNTVTREIGKMMQDNPKLGLYLQFPTTFGSTAGEEIGRDYGANSGSATKSAVGTVIGAGAGMLAGPKGIGKKALSTVAGGVAGGVAGPYAGEGTGGFVGSLAGGTLAGATGNLAKSTMDMTGKGVSNVYQGAKNMVERARGNNPNALPQEPIWDTQADLNASRVFAENQVEGQKMQMVTALKDAVEGIPKTGSPDQVQTATRALMDRAEKIGAKIENDFWDKVPKTVKVPIGSALDDLNTWEKQLKGTFNAAMVPQKQIDNLKDLYTLRDPDTGKIMKGPPTIQRMLSERAAIRQARKDEEGKAKQGLTPNWTLVRNYNQLEDQVNKTLEAALPNDVSLQQARRVSTMYNDLFSRGGVADVMARTRRGEAAVPAGQTIEELMKNYQGLGELLDIRNKLTGVRKPGGFSAAVSLGEREDLEKMVSSAEDSIRSMFRAYAEQNGNENSYKFVEKMGPSIKALATVHAELSQTGEQVKAVLRQEDIYRKSALNRFSQEDGEKAISRIWNSKDPAGEARALVNGVEGQTGLKASPDAMDGLRSGIISRFLVSARQDPTRAKNLLNTQRYKDLLRETLSPDQLERLEKVVNISKSLTDGDEALLRRKLLPGATILARITGAYVGRTIAPGQLQSASILAQTFKRTLESWFKTTDPQEMLMNAVLDPKWEKLLLQREPATTLEARQMALKMRRMVSYQDAIRQTAFAPDAKRDDNANK